MDSVKIPFVCRFHTSWTDSTHGQGSFPSPFFGHLHHRRPWLHPAGKQLVLKEWQPTHRWQGHEGGEHEGKKKRRRRRGHKGMKERKLEVGITSSRCCKWNSHLGTHKGQVLRSWIFIETNKVKPSGRGESSATQENLPQLGNIL